MEDGWFQFNFHIPKIIYEVHHKKDGPEENYEDYILRKSGQASYRYKRI